MYLRLETFQPSVSVLLFFNQNNLHFSELMKTDGVCLYVRQSRQFQDICADKYVPTILFEITPTFRAYSTSLMSMIIIKWTFTCSKLTIETLEQGVKYVQICYC